MAHRVLTWGLAMALTALSAETATASVRWPTCRPYTVERTCPPGLELCGLKMVYAPKQSPGWDRYGYWYGIPHPKTYSWSLKTQHRVVHKARPVVTHKVVHQKPVVKHKRVVVKKRAAPMTCGYRCWYKHWPEHNLPFGD